MQLGSDFIYGSNPPISSKNTKNLSFLIQNKKRNN